MSADAPPTPVPGQRYKFLVGSAEEAVTVIRQQLGENARVLSVNQVEAGGLARFLRAPKLAVIAEKVSDEEKPAEKTKGKGRAKLDAPVVAGAPLHTLPTPLAERGNDDETLTLSPAARRLTPQEQGEPCGEHLWYVLSRAGLRRDLLDRLSDRTAWQALTKLPLHVALTRAAMLLRHTAETRPKPITRRVAFFGAPGAGTTTSLCKQLAGDVFLLGRPAWAVKLEGPNPNPTEGLAAFCEALGVPLLRSPEELAAVPPEATVYFDCPGTRLIRSAAGPLADMLNEFNVDTRVLVVNAAYDADIIKENYVQATKMKATHVVFTHLDELPRVGKLWEFLLDGELSPLFVGTGENVVVDRELDFLELLVRRTLAAAHTSELEPS